MQEGMNAGVIAAILTGSVFAFVTMLEGTIGRAVGAVNATLLEHGVAGVIAFIALGLLFWRGGLSWETVRPVLPISTIVAVMVITAVGGVAYAMPRAGVAAGNMGMVLGQLALAVVIDAMGWGGYERIPLNLPRIGGLVLMAAGTYLVLPRTA